MTSQGRYSPKPKPPPANVTQVRIIGPEHVAEQVRQVLQVAAETMPGWRIKHVSRLLPAEGGRIRRYVDLEVHDG